MFLLLSCAAPTEPVDSGAPVLDTGDEEPVDCGDYVGLATAEEIAATPREETWAELLAIAVDGTFTASQPTYDRITADIAAARASYDALDMVRPDIEGFVGRNIHVSDLDEARAEALADGTLPATLCADATYARTDGSAVTSTYVVLGFEGIYDTDALATEYASLLGPGPDVFTLRQETDGDRVCVRHDGESWEYLLSAGWADCESGCACRRWYWLTSDEAGAPVLEDDWGAIPDAYGDDCTWDEDPRPAWLDGDWACAG